MRQTDEAEGMPITLFSLRLPYPEREMKGTRLLYVRGKVQSLLICRHEYTHQVRKFFSDNCIFCMLCPNFLRFPFISSFPIGNIYEKKNFFLMKRKTKIIHPKV